MVLARVLAMGLGTALARLARCRFGCSPWSPIMVSPLERIAKPAIARRETAISPLQ
jgi:hypothetical protein